MQKNSEQSQEESEFLMTPREISHKRKSIYKKWTKEENEMYASYLVKFAD